MPWLNYNFTLLDRPKWRPCTINAHGKNWYRVPHGCTALYRSGTGDKIFLKQKNAEVAELVDAHDSKSCGEIHESSILSFGTLDLY